MTATSAWSASIVVRRPDAPSAERLIRALLPESTREVPRARTNVSVREATRVVIEVETTDTGALRAAMTTFLGWVQLALATEDAARA